MTTPPLDIGVPRPLTPAQSQSEIWWHRKTGGLYRILTTRATNESDLKRVTVYESLFDGAIWVRPEEEFFDGRFINLSIDEVTSHIRRVK